ncbi:MAG: VWA domain-containing protein [Clostridia bacterium]|nr:VWA domain-containing protein [Clostridia bacterium]
MARRNPYGTGKVCKSGLKTFDQEWLNYFKNNKFSITEDIDKELKYIPLYYQKKNVSRMALAYATYNPAETRYEIFCPKSKIFRAACLHEKGHIYFGHLKNVRKYISIAEKELNENADAIKDKFNLGYDWQQEVINICMDMEVNSKLFKTKEERAELNASMRFYLSTRYYKKNLNEVAKNFNPSYDDSGEDVVFFPSSFGWPEGKSFLEYVRMCINLAKGENYKNKELKNEFTPSSDDNNESDSMPFDGGEGESSSGEMPEGVQSDNNSSENNNNKESSKSVGPEKPSSEENEKSEEQIENESSSGNKEENSSKSAEENIEDDATDEEDVSDGEAYRRFERAVNTQDKKNAVQRADSHNDGKKEPLYENQGQNLNEVIISNERYMRCHEKEENEIKEFKEKIEIKTASNFNEINKFIMRYAIPTVTTSSRNDILYNYNRGKTTDVLTNKVRNTSTFKKPCIKILTDVSGSMDAEYTKKVVKSVKTLSSKIDEKSSLQFYNHLPLNTIKMKSLTDEDICKGFIGGGTDLAFTLKQYIRSNENQSQNTLIVISDFCDDIHRICKELKNVKSRVLFVEVGSSIRNCHQDIFKDVDPEIFNKIHYLFYINKKYEL